jgi:hypothetical protein
VEVGVGLRLQAAIGDDGDCERLAPMAPVADPVHEVAGILQPDLRFTNP